jgi:hypothetical protein
MKNMSPEEKANLGGVKKLGIDLGSGITAGAAAAILSHVSLTVCRRCVCVLRCGYGGSGVVEEWDILSFDPSSPFRRGSNWT